jgi:hypothetical protein
MSTTRTGRTRRPSPRNFYRSALDTALQTDLDAAAAAEGLDDEVALLRLLVRRELAERPENLRLVLQGMTLLVRAVAARYRLSPSDQDALEQRLAAAVRGVIGATATEVIDA